MFTGLGSGMRASGWGGGAQLCLPLLLAPRVLPHEDTHLLSTPHAGETGRSPPPTGPAVDPDLTLTIT